MGEPSTRKLSSTLLFSYSRNLDALLVHAHLMTMKNLQDKVLYTSSV